MRKLSFLLLFLLLIPAARAQDFSVDPNANITWPPPVLVVRGEFRLYGTANVPNFSSYFIEYRRLNDDFTINEDGTWLPATLPSSARVTDDVLGVWNTTTIEDGPYEIRMTINVSEGSPVFVLVNPLRVENTRSPSAPATATPEPARPITGYGYTEFEVDNGQAPWSNFTGYGPRVNSVMRAYMVNADGEIIYDNRIAFNSKGMRGPEVDYAKPDDVFRILVKNKFKIGVIGVGIEKARVIVRDIVDVEKQNHEIGVEFYAFYCVINVLLNRPPPHTPHCQDFVASLWGAVLIEFSLK